nr:hypothetical protein [Candidatus Contendobacter sp.]
SFDSRSQLQVLDRAKIVDRHEPGEVDRSPRQLGQLAQERELFIADPDEWYEHRLGRQLADHLHGLASVGIAAVGEEDHKRRGRLQAAIRVPDPPQRWGVNFRQYGAISITA